MFRHLPVKLAFFTIIKRSLVRTSQEKRLADPTGMELISQIQQCIFCTRVEIRIFLEH
jgi:hypothetical protein